MLCSRICVIWKLREIDSSSNPRKDEMVLLLMECAVDEMDSEGGTEMWLNMIDRGGGGGGGVVAC